MESYHPAVKPYLSKLIVDTDKDWGNHIIKNLGEPTEPYDAVRKDYVDISVIGFGINYFLLDSADGDVPTYKSMSLTVPELPESYVETTQNSAGDYEIASWITPTSGIPLKLGVYEFHCQAEKVSGNIDVRLFYRLYERKTDNTEVLIDESMIGDKVDSRRDVIITLVLANDYMMDSGSRLVFKLYARYESGGSSTTIRVYYQGDVRSRLSVPIAKEILDTIYIQSPLVDDLDCNLKQLLNARVERVTSLPTADSSRRGQIVILDSGSGNPDKVYICLKNSSDSYEWVQIGVAT